MKRNLCLLVLAACNMHAATVVLQDATVIDGTGAPPREHAAIVIQDGRITAVAPKNARVIRLSGKTVIPGIINGHGHLGLTEGTASGPQVYSAENVERQLLQYQRYGVTRVVSLGLNHDIVYELRDQQRAGKLGGAAIMTADRGIGAAGGVPPASMSSVLYRPKTADEARRDVREIAGRHPDLVKLWVDDNLGKVPKMDPEVYAAIIDESHKNGLKVAAHVFYLEDAKRLVRDGVNILAHSVRDAPVDDELIQLMKQRRTFYIPTLQLEEAFFIYGDHPAWMSSLFFTDAAGPELAAALVSGSNAAAAPHRKFLETAEQNLKRISDAGIPVGFGTDSGAFPNRIQGFAEHRELYLMVASGMSPLQAIHSATAVNAQMLGIEGRAGTIETGKAADLVVLGGDPSSNIANTTRVEAVWQGGVEVVHLHDNAGVTW